MSTVFAALGPFGDAWSDGDDIRFDVCAHPDMDFAARGASDILNGVPLDGEPARLALAQLKADGSADLQRTGQVAEPPLLVRVTLPV